ncbi:serine hydrolase [Streptomyces justiciae]|uniref:serine hydrolase n=1 Tax=Streptomyces justiciae TaxID=2780140 RepID=UPI00187E48D2|nr:serine hydrolase [Streptomyces justiciae]
MWTRGRCFRIASLTKVFTSAALVRPLRDKGVPPTTPAIDLLPALAPGWRADRGLTVEQLLGQVSGLRESVDAATVKALGDRDDVRGRATEVRPHPLEPEPDGLHHPSVGRPRLGRYDRTPRPSPTPAPGAPAAACGRRCRSC